MLFTAGNQTITATDTADGSITGSATVTVNPAAASSLRVYGFKSPTARGAFHHFFVAAIDPYGNIATGYTGTVHFTSDEDHASLPADYIFTAADQGVHRFRAAFNRFGTFSLTATDTSNPSITGTQSGIVVINKHGGGGGSGLPSGKGRAGSSTLDVAAMGSAARTADAPGRFVVNAVAPHGTAATASAGPSPVEGFSRLVLTNQNRGQAADGSGTQSGSTGMVDRVLADWDGSLIPGSWIDDLIRNRLG